MKWLIITRDYRTEKKRHEYRKKKRQSTRNYKTGTHRKYRKKSRKATWNHRTGTGKQDREIEKVASAQIARNIKKTNRKLCNANIHCKEEKNKQSNRSKTKETEAQQITWRKIARTQKNDLQNRKLKKRHEHRKNQEKQLEITEQALKNETERAADQIARNTKRTNKKTNAT